jgi:hypothetical protein
MAQDSAVLLVMAGALLLALIMAALIWTLGRSAAQPDTPVDYERRRLYFAAVVLTGLGLIFLMAMSMFYFAPTDPAERLKAGSKIFETCVSVIPPIVTLVLGYYFGRSDSLRTGGGGTPTAGSPTAGPPTGHPR